MRRLRRTLDKSRVLSDLGSRVHVLVMQNPGVSLHTLFGEGLFHLLRRDERLACRRVIKVLRDHEDATTWIVRVGPRTPILIRVIVSADESQEAQCFRCGCRCG